MYARFEQDIERMNATYQLAPVRDNIVAYAERLVQFKEILDKEFVELEEVGDSFFKNPATQDMNAGKIVIKTELADLLGDIIVYCASEAKRWGIPLPQVLQIIMASNFSKLGADGLPIKNPKTDKFEKGPNYWKPEPFIEALLTGKILDVQFDEQGTAHVATATAEPAAAQVPTQSPQD